MAAATATVAAAAAAAAPELPPLVAGAAVHPGWRELLLPAQKQPPTRYSAETVQGRAALRMDAQASYGNLLHELPRPAAPQRLQWAWRVPLPNAATDLRRKAGDDVAAKVCLSLDLPLAGLPLAERALLRLARIRSGEALPAATLCWVWGGALARGSVVDNAYTRRVRYVVLRNAGDAAGPWYEESRDIDADFRRAFGDELAAGAELPPVLGVLVGADADNTGGRSLAHLDALRFAP